MTEDVWHFHCGMPPDSLQMHLSLGQRAMCCISNNSVSSDGEIECGKFLADSSSHSLHFLLALVG